MEFYVFCYFDRADWPAPIRMEWSGISELTSPYCSTGRGRRQGAAHALHVPSGVGCGRARAACSHMMCRRCSPAGPQRQKRACCAGTLTRSFVHVLLPAGPAVSRAAMSGFIAGFKSLDFYRSVQPSSPSRSPRAVPAAHLPPVQGAASEHTGENSIMFSLPRPCVSPRPNSFSCCVSGS